MRCPAIKQKDVLITGCSSGIGLAAAHRLREAGWRVLPTARKPEDIERLREAGFDPIRMDLADADSVQQGAEAALGRCGGSLGALVNNAGFGQPGAMEDLGRDAMRRQFEVNVFGLQHLTNLVLPGMRSNRAGRIVNVSSVLGRVTLPYMGCYSASKHAVESFSDALRIELDGTGIGIILVEPGPIATAFRSNLVDYARDSLDFEAGCHADRYRQEIGKREGGKLTPRTFTVEPDAVAKVIVRALEATSPRRRYRVTVPARVGELLRRLAPDAWIDAAMKLQARS